jgi:hypothetical protein
MKKNLTIIAIALLVLAMAIPASAASLSLKGEYSAKFTFDYAASGETWTPDILGADANHKLKLNLTFTEGESIVAYLPLTMTNFGATPSLAIGSWYFSYDTAPWAFWVSKNDADNAKKFASLGDPMGIVATSTLDAGDADLKAATKWALNANGDILGAGLNLYALDYVDKAGWVGRAKYTLPMDFTLGLVGAYTNFGPEETDETAGVKDDLTFGADVVGKIPGLDATLTLAGAGYWSKADTWKFESAEDNVAFLAKVSDLKLGPVSGWASYTGVGGGFVSHYKATAAGAILNKYAGSAAAEVEITAELPVGIPTALTLGDTFWMDYPTDPKWNATTGKVEVTPIEGLKVIVSGAYRMDLNEEDDEPGTIGDPEKPNKNMFAGYKARADVEYEVFGLTLNPYAYYEKDSYADWAHHGIDNARTDTAVGLNVSGSPLAGLDLNLEAEYVIEEPETSVLAWGAYTSELNPGFVKSAMTKIAGVAELGKVGEGEVETGFYGYAGSDIVVTDKLSAKVGVLTKDDKGKIAATAGLTYAASDSISTGITFTYRQEGIVPSETIGEGEDEVANPYYTMWRPFDDEGTCYLGANVKGTVGESTITLAYGNTGLVACECDDDSFHIDKPWTWMYHHPGTFMNWQLVTLSVKVPF